MHYDTMCGLCPAAEWTGAGAPGGLVLAPPLPLGCHEDFAEGHCTTADPGWFSDRLDDPKMLWGNCGRNIGLVVTFA